MTLHRPIALLVALAFGGCAQYATVTEKHPELQPSHASTGAMAKVHEEITAAMRVERHDPLKALGGFLSSVDAAARQLAQNPGDEAARRAYNFAVSRIFTAIRAGKLDPWSKPLRVPAAGGDFLLTHRSETRKTWNPALYDFTPADQFDVKGTYVSEHSRKEGVGATLVAEGRGVNEYAAADFGMAHIYYGVTAVARFEGRRCIIGFDDPLATETVVLNGRSFPLAADFTVPLAVMLAKTNPKKLEMSRLLNPEKYAETARVARLQPFDPNKTVVLVIHGLMDSPATWAPMINDLRSDETIRRNYQFWFYSYPSGYAYPHSAAILRRELDGIEKRYPMHKKMIVIGHSMGGCISRLLITDVDDKLWIKTFGKPPGEMQFSSKTKQLVSDALIFRHRPEIGRVIFISAPLRGSDLASNWMGRIGSSLVHGPTSLLQASSEVMQFVKTQGDSLKLNRLPNSVDTLAPNNRFVQNINTFPLTPGIPYNVISGNRGKGGNKDHTPPVMSDGIVPYWSSHMEGAQSELVVPSHHSAHQNPQAIAEVRRILRSQAGK